MRISGIGLTIPRTIAKKACISKFTVDRPEEEGYVEYDDGLFVVEHPVCETALVVLGLWIAGAGSIGFLLALALIGLLVARYATSRAGVGSVPSPTSGRGGSTVRTTARSPSTSGGGNTVTEGRFELGRALPVLRGWLTVAVLLVIGAAGSVSLWIVDGGPAGLLVGLALVGAVAAWYSVSGTW